MNEDICEECGADEDNPHQHWCSIGADLAYDAEMEAAERYAENQREWWAEEDQYI